MVSKFVGRQKEIALLEDEWNKTNGKLIILYGRRRIGKTRLITEFISDKNGIFYFAQDTSAHIQIAGLQERIAEFTGDEILRTLEIKDWDQLFGYLAKNCPDERFYLAIDEFSYLIKSDRSILSTLQKYWDTIFSSSNIFIILSGSMLGLMSEMVLSHASPLYGRRSRDMLLEGLPFSASREFLNMSFQEALETYMILGGVPEYLLKASEYTDILDFVEKEFFDKFGYFYREPYFIISQEFKELKIYLSILNSIAFGNTRPTEIANFVGVDARKIYPYLENLIRLEFIERRVSVFGNQKKGIYFIRDQVFDFWFNFVFKYKGDIEKEVFELKNDEMPRYFGKKFETFVEQEVIHHFIPDFRKIGRWWHKGEEIDLLALNEDERKIAFIECKWQNVDIRRSKHIFTDLKRKAALVKWRNDERSEIYGIIGKKIEGKDRLREEGYLAFDLEDIRLGVDGAG